ncbi:MAG: hypothetical protein RR387_04785 [Clostridiales bacterium]
MVMVTIIFLVVFVLCYPLTFKLTLVAEGWRLWWLPRVFGGYASPVFLKEQALSFLSPGDEGVGRLVKRMLGYFRWHKLDIEIKLGGGNPLVAAMMCGALYAVLGGVIGSQARLSDSLDSPRLDIGMDQQQNGVFYRGECIVSVSCGDIISRRFWDK